ncbi:MAG: efflux RND transporter permease subunit, partial [Gemmatimonadota bacterium]|nr:efflux RND transporter permease subunit [Gemmatimonadota bacterium]
MIVSNVAIKNKTSVFVLTVVIVIMGLVSYFSLPREAAPSITIPMIFVATPYFGVSPSDMENLVTQPIEKRVKELSNIKEISSTSSEGISTVVIEFEP